MEDGRIPKSASREDCWTEAATSILIDAWGESYLALGRGNLKQQHWKEVADIVNTSPQMHGKSPKTDMQCKNRIDTVKKKYKLEKSKITAPPITRWSFFHKLHHLIGHATKSSPLIPKSFNNLKMQRHPAHEDTHSSETNSPESTDTYPPNPAKKQRTIHNSTATSNPKGKRTHDGRSNKKSCSIAGFTKAILNLGEAYEQTESAKMRQVMEMEKHRMMFTKDLELQRMHLFMKAQLEICQMKQVTISSCPNQISSNNHLHHQLHTNHTNHVNNNNVSNLNNDGT